MDILYRDFWKLSKSLSKNSQNLNRKKFKGKSVDAEDTIFLFYPEPKYVENRFDKYKNCREYFWYHKRGQRNVLEKYFNIPPRAEDTEAPYIVRPVRHFGGRNFYVAENDAELQDAHDNIDGRSYGVGVFRRTREFRAFFVKGENTATMLKSLEGYGYANRENLPDPEDDELQLRPWNRSQMEGTRYLTITREVNDKLLTNTEFYNHADSFFEKFPFDLLAVDVAYNDQTDEYVVFETNFSPQCTIQTVLEPTIKKMLRMERFS